MVTNEVLPFTVPCPFYYSLNHSQQTGATSFAILLQNELESARFTRLVTIEVVASCEGEY